MQEIWKRVYRNIFPLKKPFKNVEEGHVIIPAFKIDTIQYYQIHDVFNTFTMRAMDALSHYEKWQMRCSREFLIDHTKAVDAILRDPKKIDIIKIAELNSVLKERLEFALPTEQLIWNFLAVAFFDENESPYKYDDKYGQDKIARWKSKTNITDFFLQVKLHLNNIIPCPDFSKSDLEMLLPMIEKIDTKHLQKVISILSFKAQSNVS